MKLIGLTGGIGSGKSTVAGVFQLLGIPVYESDERAKYLMHSNAFVKAKLIDLFGQDAYLENDQLNRSWIASRVFSDSVQLDKLNKIVHPAVYQDLVNWAGEQNSPYLIQESAILFEENLMKRLKAIILVVADEETRITRVMKRDDVSREQVLKRISHQWRDEKKFPLSDYVIYNDGNRSLINQVMDIDIMIKSIRPPAPLRGK